jgi:hypothetical protein
MVLGNMYVRIMNAIEINAKYYRTGSTISWKTFVNSIIELDNAINGGYK